MRAPTTSWWWNEHAVGRDLARLGLADVVEQRREPERRASGSASRLLDHGERVVQHVLVLVHRVLLELQRGELGQELVGETGLDQQLQSARGSGRGEQLGELVADPLGRHDLEAVAHLLDRLAPRAAAGSRSSCATNRAARSIRSGSSENATSGSSGVSSRLAARSFTPPNGIDELALGQPDRHRVDREVAPGQVGLQVLAERHRGLAVLLRVDLLAEGRDLQDAGRPCGRRPCRTSRRPGTAARPSRAGPSSSRAGRRRSRSPDRSRAPRPAAGPAPRRPRGRARDRPGGSARRARWRSGGTRGARRRSDATGRP